MLLRHLSNFSDLSGSRILEIGCGNGELTQSLSNLVGLDGEVIALDNNEKALESAQTKIKSFEYSNVQLIESNISSLPITLTAIDECSIDLLVGRRVLMYLKHPTDVIKELSKYLKKGGGAIFQESDPTITPARIDAMPAHDQATEWMRAMLVQEDVHMTMGFSLPKTLIDSGLEFGKVFAEAVIQGQGEQFVLPDMIKILSQRIINAGIATQSEIDNIVVSLIDESNDKSKIYISDMSFCAWASKA